MSSRKEQVQRCADGSEQSKGRLRLAVATAESSLHLNWRSDEVEIHELRIDFMPKGRRGREIGLTRHAGAADHGKESLSLLLYHPQRLGGTILSTRIVQGVWGSL